MILQINKYHRTVAGETCTSAKIEKQTYKEVYEKAIADFHQFAHDYMADASVLEYALSVFDPRTQMVIEKTQYTKELPAEETAEE